MKMCAMLPCNMQSIVELNTMGMYISWCTNSRINVLEYAHIVATKFLYEKIRLDVVKLYTYPATCIGICM